jgi:hypothetical protein
MSSIRPPPVLLPQGPDIVAVLVEAPEGSLGGHKIIEQAGKAQGILIVTNGIWSKGHYTIDQFTQPS